MEQYDAIIIGFGKGGKTLAGKLAGMGSKVALVEKSDKMYGGTCINAVSYTHLDVYKRQVIQ